jgi:GTPase SAR1 family protein
MSESPATSIPLAAVPRSALRVVLFGMPGAGKSSLVGALAQAAQTQEHILNGHLRDLGQGFREMQRRLYEEGPRETLDEVIPFPLVFEPFSRREPGRIEAVLIDCDGRAANEILLRKRELDRSGGELSQALLAADAVVFVVDASASAMQMDADFTECARFLRLLEERRGQRADIGGLPVFLVLTKCDLLAQPEDDLAGWFERVEERKRQVGRRFQSFLEKEARTSAVGFGSIRLHIWATAVKRPALADSPAKPREPYGVAELFRQCLGLAHDFRIRRGQSSRRLVWVVLGALVALALLAVLPVLLILNRPTDAASDLEARVSQYEASEQEETLPARYRQTQERIDRLASFRAESAFAALPDEQKEWVENRYRDLRDYRDFAGGVYELDPRTVRSAEQVKDLYAALNRLDERLKAHSHWTETDAGQRLVEMRTDLQAIEKAVQDTIAGYENVIRNGEEVLRDKEKPMLPTRARNVLDAAKSLPNPRLDTNKRIPGSDHVTYSTVFNFDRVQEVLGRWEKVREKLSFPASIK